MFPRSEFFFQKNVKDPTLGRCSWDGEMTELHQVDGGCQHGLRGMKPPESFEMIPSNSDVNTDEDWG